MVVEICVDEYHVGVVMIKVLVLRDEVLFDKEAPVLMEVIAMLICIFRNSFLTNVD